MTPPTRVNTDGQGDLSDDLIESLAARAHDAWMAHRAAQGWKAGGALDRDGKETPCLVEYAVLPEAEKAVDRAVVRATLGGLVAMGFGLVPPPSPGDAGSRNLAAWESALAREREVASPPRAGARVRTFDMDDAPDLAVVPAGEALVLRGALDAVATSVLPRWIAADREARRRRDVHRFVARVAIFAGTVAIVAAVGQLMVRGAYPEASGFAHALGRVEVIAVIASAAAVVGGFAWKPHHEWLRHRHIAERLRNLKFTSLGWPELWGDPASWRTRLDAEASRLETLSFDDVRRWATWEDSAITVPPRTPATGPSAEAEAVATYYREKRLEFQKAHFARQAGRAARESWAARWHLPLVIFAASVFAVIGHAAMGTHAPGSPPARVEVVLVGLAAILPVLGFGLRAWLAAFEIPRSRNLFRAKEAALANDIARLSANAFDVEATSRMILAGEQFFANEHREWCRLHLEAEWFL